MKGRSGTTQVANKLFQQWNSCQASNGIRDIVNANLDVSNNFISWILI